MTDAQPPKQVAPPQRLLVNSYRGNGRGQSGAISVPDETPWPSIDAQSVQALLRQCPAARETPLLSAPELAQAANVSNVFIKDERDRMGLGSFKALGAAYVIARDAAARGGDLSPTALQGVTYVAASAGNHGLSVVAGARAFGATAVIYIAQTVPVEIERKLAARGATVRREGADYAASMAAAMAAAEAHGWQLLSDSSWPGYYARALRVMEGYLALSAEVVSQIPAPPSHIFLQAGVGGLAGAVAAHARAVWGDAPQIVVVEPAAAPALQASIRAGQCTFAPGPDSNMGRLDCKEPSLIALKGLARDADFFMTITEQEAREGTGFIARAGHASTPSGSAGLVALLNAGDQRATLGLNARSNVLAILSEGPIA